MEYLKSFKIHNRFEIHDIQNLSNEKFLVFQPFAQSHNSRRPFAEKFEKLKFLFHFIVFYYLQIRLVQFYEIEQLVFQIYPLHIFSFAEFFRFCWILALFNLVRFKRDKSVIWLLHHKISLLFGRFWFSSGALVLLYCLW